MSFYTTKIKRFLPVFLQDVLSLTRRVYLRRIRHARTTRLATRLLGREYARSRDLIEIDITYVCNLRCAGCNRSCPQAPTGEMMAVREIEKFIAESIDAQYYWKRIRIVGGEPTLHPQIHRIVEILLDYIRDFSIGTKIMLITNGAAALTKKVISEMPPEVEIVNTQKTPEKDNIFARFNSAPIDDARWRDADFTNGCRIAKDCGTGLTPYGYYPCAPAGAIDRVFGLDIGRKQLPGTDDGMHDILTALCRYCGHFRDERPRLIDSGCSPAWARAYEQYRANKPSLTRYGAA